MKTNSVFINSNQSDNRVAIRTVALTNRFPNGLVSNLNNDFTLHFGKIHVIFGENGAGKSTFVKMLCGEIVPTSGQIWVQNQKISSSYNPRLASQMGIGIVRQHFNLIDDFTVFENVVLGHELVVSEQRQKNTANFEESKSKILLAKETELSRVRNQLTKIEQDYAVRLEKLQTLPLNKDEGETEATRREQINELLKQKATMTKQFDLEAIDKKYAQKMHVLYNGFNQQNLSNFYRRNCIRKDLQKIIAEFNLKINLDAKVKDISIIEKQQTEILKTLYRGSEIIVFDEPTSVLPGDQIETFLESLKQYKEQGKAIIFISHKINEIRDVADEITVLRHGKMVGHFNIDDVTDEKLVSLMIGGKLNVENKESRTAHDPTLPLLLSAEDVNLEKEGKVLLDEINFNLYRGEIVGLAGIDNNGQSSLLRSLYGLLKNSSGSYYYHHKNENKDAIELNSLSIHKRQKLGISYLSQDRLQETTLLNEPLYANLAFNDLTNSEFFPYKLFNKSLVSERVYEIVKKYQIAGFSSYNQPLSSLSGGNIQKFLIGRELEKSPHLMLIDEPTWGIDVKAKNYLYSLFVEAQKQRQLTILFASVDLKEIVTISDRVFIMSKGKIVGVVKVKDKAEALSQIGALMTRKVT